MVLQHFNYAKTDAKNFALSSGVPVRFFILYTMKNIFQTDIFLYSPCPNLEGIKDALSYKFRRLTIGQNCCAVCTNEVARA